MKLPRRAAASLAAFLMAASLALAPSMSRAHFIDGPLNNPPPRDGDPDTPGDMVIAQKQLGLRLPLIGRVFVYFDGRNAFFALFWDHSTGSRGNRAR